MFTIIHQFEEAVEKYADKPYLWEKKYASYESLTYRQTKDLVYKFSAGLIELGIEKGDRLAFLLEGRNEWVIGELGILYAGAVNVPLSVKLNSDEIYYRLEHSGAKVIVASEYQLRKLHSIVHKLPLLETIILVDIESASAEKKTHIESNKKEINFRDVLSLGASALLKDKNPFELRRDSVCDSDYATICYTSGTTAESKGIVLSHRNYTANVEQALNLIDVPSYYVSLLILPWDHSFAHTAGVYTVMKAGASIASVQIGKGPMETLKNIPVNIKEIKPHFICSVPALAKNFRKNIENGIYGKGKVIVSLFKFGLSVAYLYNGNGFNRGRGFRAFLKPINALMDKILFSKIRENFGNRMDFFVGGGALLDIDLQQFFYAIGIPMLQGYGLTEASPIISVNSLKSHKMGSSGKVVGNMELKICDGKGVELAVGEKGEIVVKGENVMSGYWRNKEATAETIKNSWLHTGDLGYLDKDGFLYVSGRFKSLLIADDGEKYSPEGIEEALVAHSAMIEQCMLYNNQNPYTVALIVPNKELIKRWLKDKQIQNQGDPTGVILKQIGNEINEFRHGRKYGHMFPQRWLPVAIAILDEAFTEDNNLLNSTLKLVRPKVCEKYSRRINYLYSSEAKDIANKQNRIGLEQLLKS